MLMESVQGLSFFNVGTRRLEKVDEVLDKHMTTEFSPLASGYL